MRGWWEGNRDALAKPADQMVLKPDAGISKERMSEFVEDGEVEVLTAAQGPYSYYIRKTGQLPVNH
jgi:hypothetical protein